MTGVSNSRREPDPQARDVPKNRACLRCKVRFESQWSGERICRRCKNSTNWRNGLPVGMRSVGR